MIYNRQLLLQIVPKSNVLVAKHVRRHLVRLLKVVRNNSAYVGIDGPPNQLFGANTYIEMTTTMATSTFSAKLSKTGTPKVHSITLGTNRSTDVCPPPMLGEIADATSPHHLFLASIGACVNLVFEIALSKARIEVFELHSNITGDYETDDETGVASFTTVQIDTNVTLPEGIKESKVERLFEVAHKNCPIGNCLVGSCVKLITNLNITYQ